MQLFRQNVLLCLAFVTSQIVHAEATPSKASNSPEPLAEQALTELPYTPGLDLSAMDRTVQPCEDFYQYSCGGWMKNNPIPADQARWDVFRKLSVENTRYLWSILENLGKSSDKLSAEQQKLSQYFQACMDEKTIESKKASPLLAEWAALEQLKQKRDLATFLAPLHMKAGGGGAFFSIGSNQDFTDTESVIFFVDDGGMGLPDRDYYLEQDPRSKRMLQEYQQHIGKMLVMTGASAHQAERDAKTIVSMETDLAKASLSKVERRNPHNLANKISSKSLAKMTPAFDWAAYFQAAGIAPQQVINVSEPKLLRAVNRLIQQRSLNDLKLYIRWHALLASSPYLSKDFVEENFALFSKTLRGIPQMEPRWKRCVRLVDMQLGEALGQEYVRRNFSPDMKEKTQHMTQQIEAAMREDILSLTWMSEATKQEALKKLATVANKVGYPDTWRDYSKFEVKADDFFGNVLRGSRFELERSIGKIGKPLDRSEWGMTPQTVNAYYNPQMNDINFPAAVLRAPLYDPKMDAAPNYGNTGGTIGHELTHGFDDEGRQFDSKGNLKDWWTKKDTEEFTKRSQCIVDQYSQYTVVDEVKINGKLTLGEDVADLGGLLLAYMAWKAEIATLPAESRDGFTPEQRFFIGFAQWACENDRPENQRLSAKTNPHSPGKYRINGVVVNMPEFKQAFACKSGQAMVKEPPCRVW